eukprot:19074_1
MMASLVISICFGIVIGGKPNIVLMLTDDLGWNSAWNNPETITPTLDAMSKTGLLLESFYTFKYCSPTRGSFLTGRYPYKLCATRQNLVPAWDLEGINLAYTMLPQKLALGGYVSYHIGKWHQGLMTDAYLPINRGFNYSFGFLSGGEHHFSEQTGAQCNVNGATFHVVDFFENGSPAYGKNGTYDAYQYCNAAVNIIETHSQKYTDEQPLFLYYALHNTHSPIEAPPQYVKMYNFNQSLRNTFDAMVSVVDETVLNVTNALKKSGLWNNTLFIWTTDNGGWINVAGSNKPLRGGKQTNFEGGVHVPALVSGGMLPNKMAGQSLKGLMHILDLHSTFCNLADVNPNETNKNAPSQIDSLNMWKYISGQVTDSPRTQIVHDHDMYTNVTHGSLRSGNYKIIVNNESMASWYGQFSPNETWNNNMKNIFACSVDKPCLFDIENDPTEHIDLSETLPNVTKQLLQEFHSFDNKYHAPKKAPGEDKQGYCEAAKQHNGFSLPWKN